MAISKIAYHLDSAHRDHKQASRIPVIHSNQLVRMRATVAGLPVVFKDLQCLYSSVSGRGSYCTDGSNRRSVAKTIA